MFIPKMEQQVRHSKSRQNILGPVLCVLVLALFLASCQSSTYYTRSLSVYTVQDVETWHIMDSLVISNRSCDRFDRDRRVLWLMIWEKMNADTYTVHLFEDRIIPENAYGCVFLGGEPVIIHGDVVDGLFRKTEPTIELRADIQDIMYPETFSTWTLNFADNNFEITASYPLPCWRMRDPPSDP